MAAHSKAAQELARTLFKLSVEHGSVSADRVAGVLAYLEKHRPANPVLVLKAYRRLIAAELARSEVRVEHAGPLAANVLASITAALSQKYHRPLTSTAQSNPALIAGLRIRVGDDIYESSVAGQLADLAASV